MNITKTLQEMHEDALHRLWELRVEINDKGLVHVDPAPHVMITPVLDENFWLVRVPLTEHQAVVVFPKFGLYGCGMQIEEQDWNTNLPLRGDGDEVWQAVVFEHIKRNLYTAKSQEVIPSLICLKAISLLDQAVADMKADRVVGQYHWKGRVTESALIDSPDE